MLIYAKTFSFNYYFDDIFQLADTTNFFSPRVSDTQLYFQIQPTIYQKRVSPDPKITFLGLLDMLYVCKLLNNIR